MIPIQVLQEMPAGAIEAVGAARVERTPFGRWVVWEHTEESLTPRQAYQRVVATKLAHRAQYYISRILERTGTKLTVSALLMVVLLGLSSTARAQEVNDVPRLKLPLTVFTVAAAADGVTTFRNLKAQQCAEIYCVGGHERNPLLRPFKTPVKTAVAMAVGDIATILIAKKLGKRHPKLVTVFLYASAGARGFFAVRNAVSLSRSQAAADALNAKYGPYRW